MDWSELARMWSMPLIAAFTGWFTTYVGIRMLFRPRQPVRLFGFSYQAPLPKRQAEIALRVGTIVEEELLNYGDLRNELVTAEFQAQLVRTIYRQTLAALKEKRERLPGLTRPLMADTVLRKVSRLMAREVEARLPELVSQAFALMADHVSIEGLVSRKVAAFELEKLEEVVLSLAKRELRIIELFCGGMGFVIGLVQMVLMG